MSIKSNILLLASLTVLISACGSDKNESAPEETVASMSQLKATDMSTCPAISGRYKCIENCEVNGEPMSEDAGPILLKQRGQGLERHYSTGEEQPKDFIGYIVDKYLFDDGGFIVDGKIHDKTALVKTGLEVINRQITGLAGHVLRQSLALIGIDVDQELLKIDIPNITAGYQAGCSKDVFTIHYVFGSTAIKHKMKNLSHNILEVKAFMLEDGKLESHKAKFELIEAVSVETVGQEQRKSMPAAWLEKNRRSAEFENVGTYSALEGEYLNISFDKVHGEQSLYRLRTATWGPMAKLNGYFELGLSSDLSDHVIFVDVETLEVFARNNTTNDKKVLGYIYEKDGRGFINLDVNCGGGLLNYFFGYECTIQ